MKCPVFFIIVILLNFDWHQVNAKGTDYFLQTHLNNQNGLPQNSIRDLVFSQSGFMWLATEDGLVCYNGKTTKVYNKENSVLTSNRISQFIPSNNGKLYFVCENLDLYEIKETAPMINIERLDKIPPIGFGIYYLFAIDSLSQFRALCKNFLPENRNTGSQSSYFILKEKKMIAQRSKEGLILYSQDLTLIKRIKIPIDFKNNTLFVQQGDLYLFDSKGLFYMINLDTEKLEKLKSPDGLMPNGRIFWNGKTGDVFWVGNELLCGVKINKKLISLEKLVNDLPNLDILNISQNKENKDIALGTTSNGVYLYHKRLFNIYHSNSSTDIFYAQCPRSDSNSVYSGNPLQIVGKNDEGRNMVEKSYSYNQSSLYKDKNSNCWFAKRDSLFCLDHRTHKISKALHIPTANRKAISCIYPKDDLSFYLGTAKNLIIYKIDSGSYKISDFPQDIIQPYCMLKESDSIILIGTHLGLYKFNLSKGNLSLKCLNKHIVRSLFKTSTGSILAGTYGNGIYCIKNDKSFPIPLDKNENLKSTHAFMEDKNHLIWMSTNNGLYKVAVQEIDEYLLGVQKSKPYYYRYSYDDGLLTNEFNGGCFPSAVAVNNSTWSFPTLKGLVWFQPELMPISQNYSNIYIDKILLNDSILQISNKNNIHTINHRFKLRIYLTAPNWSDDNNLQIEYKLFDNDKKAIWNLLKDNKSPIEFQNLSGGKHNLMIRKRIGIVSKDYQEIRFTIEVPKLFYENKWFWWFLGILFMIFVYGLNRLSILVVNRKKKKLELLVDAKTVELRDAIQLLEKQNTHISNSKKELKKENELKSTLLFLLSHDIASPLRYINSFLGSSLQPSIENPISHSDLIDLKISTNNLENLLDNIVAWIKHASETNNQPRMTEFDIYQIAEEKIRLFELAINKKKVKVINHIQQGTLITTDQFICSMAMQNLLGNAINYIQEGSIDIDFVENSSHYEIILTDTGIGISEEILALIIANNNAYNDQTTHQSLGGYGIGIKITNKLLTLINGQLIFKQNENSRGTIATISIKKSNLGIGSSNEYSEIL